MLAIWLITFGCSATEGYTWKENKFTKMIEQGQDMSNVTGFKRGADWKKGAKFDDIKVNTATLPDHWDWREYAALRKVKNQGSCGSCWGFSVGGVTELVWQLIHPEMYPKLILGEQALVSCSQYDCGGGNFDAFDYIKTKGLPLESDYPYTASNGSCKSYTPYTKITGWAYVGDGSNEPTTEQIKQAIYDHGPVSVDLAANSSWSGYSSGVYTSCNSSSVNHMIIAVGFDKDVLIVLNSWGEDWGEGGYMRTKFVGSNGRKCNAMGETTAYAIVDGIQNLREYLGLNTVTPMLKH